VLHDVAEGTFEIGEFRIATALVCHPGPTVGYRIAAPRTTLAYLPDHEPALGATRFPLAADWTSGHGLAAGVDLPVHDAQYTTAEYTARVGWGHSTLEHTLAFAMLARVKHLVTFHHDPAHDDETIDCITAEAVRAARPPFPVTAGAEGATFELG
jgi:ribonuclease BN (tRNA processing enzyme)